MKLWSQIRDRYAALDVFGRDTVIAIVFSLAYVVEVALLTPTEDGSRAVTMVVGLAALAALPWRRTNLLECIAWFSAVAIAQEPIDSSYFLETTTTPFIAFLFISYAIGRETEGRRSFAYGLLFFVGIDTALLLGPNFDLVSAVFGGVFVVVPALVGRGFRNRALIQEELQGRVRQAESEGRLRAERAVQIERARIAGELQAVVANGVSAMVVQAESVPRLLAAGDAAGGSVALETIEATGRDALAEMRRLLGVLRRDNDGTELAPQPSLTRLGTLVEGARRRGLEVAVEAELPGEELPGGIDLSAYRAIQAGLEDALVAGASHATVVCRCSDRVIELEVTDDRPREAPGGDEIAALQSRFDIYGGQVSAGRERSGFRLRGRLPRRLR